MKTLNVEKIQNDIRTFTTERDWNQFHSVKNLVMALSVETSELLEIFQWMKEEDSNNLKSNPETMGKVRDEVADVLVYLLGIADKLDIDVEQAIIQKMKKNAEKYPVDKARGSSRKYDQL